MEDEVNEVEIPQDLFVDMVITLNKLADKFNCDDGQLADAGLDWWYFHKITRRSKVVAEKLGVEFN